MVTLHVPSVDVGLAMKFPITGGVLSGVGVIVGVVVWVGVWVGVPVCDAVGGAGGVPVRVGEAVGASVPVGTGRPGNGELNCAAHTGPGTILNQRTAGMP